MYKHEKYPGAPERSLDSFDRWAKSGIPPGDFGMAVLTNDLVKAVGHADKENSRRLTDIVGYVYNELPSGCWGSKEQVQRWKEKIQASEDIET